MPLTARQLNRTTLARQLLLRREPVGVVEAVARVVALQAQEPASPYLALWNRVEGFEPADLDAAYLDHDVVKATLMRITLHAVAAADHPPFHHAMVGALRASRLNDKRFRESGLTVEQADALVDDVLAFAAEPRTNAEVDAWLESNLGGPAPRAWWALRTYAPVVHAPTGPPWSHGPRPAYSAAPTTPPTGDPAGSVQHLVRRYLEGFGPATAADIGRFTILRKPAVDAALAAMAGELEVLDGPAGARLLDVPGAAVLGGDEPAPPRLLGMWDSVLLAYADRSRIIPEAVRTTVIRRNGDVLPTILVDGHVAGVWRAVDGAIEVTALARLPKGAWAGLEPEAAALRTFLADRDPAVYRRSAHWWDAIDGTEVRRLAEA
jgi:hypothetical protein